MAWGTPPTFTAHTTLGASSLQTLSDNESYLLTGFSANGKYDKGADITGTSATFAAADSTGLAKTVTLSGTKALIICQFVALADATRNICYDFNVNGTRWSSTGADGRVFFSTTTTAAGVTVVGVIDGLTPGSNTFQLLYKTNSGTLTIRAGAGGGTPTDTIPAFDVWGA